MEIKPKKSYINISAPSVDNREYSELKDTLESGWLTQGPKVKKFEDLFKKKFGFKHSFAVSSCTAGLHIALLALNFKKGSEIVVPSFTWVSCANVVLNAGLKLVLCDIKKNDVNSCHNEIIKKVGPRTKAIIIPHLFGNPVNIKILKKKLGPEIKIIEDCACAVGARIANSYCGTDGDIGVFSFHPRKIITTGEGGMVVCNDDNLANKIDMFRNHGAGISEEIRHLGPKPYLLPDFYCPGLNYRMTDLQGSIGYIQLKKIDNFLNFRNKWANYYINELKNNKYLTLPKIKKNYFYGWQSFVCFYKNKKISRNSFMDILEKNGVATRPGTHAIHLLYFYKKKYSQELINSKSANDNTIALPLHNKMKPKDFKKIVNIIINL